MPQRSPLTTFESRLLKSLSRKRVRLRGSWLLGLTGIVTLLVWDWKLLLATGSGITGMLLLYLIQGNWQAYLSTLQRFVSGSNRQLVFAVSGGGIASVTTYMAIAIWMETDNHWLATSSILQGFAMLAIISLLLWQNLGDSFSTRDETEFSQHLKNLTAVDPLQRLIAIRQITHLLIHQKLNPLYQQQTVEYFRLMLSQEQPSVIQNAILESLQALDKEQPLTKPTKPLQIPLSLKRSTKRVRSSEFRVRR